MSTPQTDSNTTVNTANDNDDSSTDFDVIVIGAGPVGMALALDLAQRGVDVGMVEQRRVGDAPPAKCNHVSARSMEYFRQLGVAQALRDTGLPADYPNDVSYRTTFVGDELTRIEIPCRRDRFTATDGPDCGWPTPEPPHRINQVFLEPVLVDAVANQPGITLLSDTVYVTHADTEIGVRVEVTDADGSRTLTARYLVGCDGASSAVRKTIGARLQGDDELQFCQSTYFDAPDLIDRQGIERAWATFSVNPTRVGNVYAIDGVRRWVVHNYLRPNETFDDVDRDTCLRAILGVDDDFEYTVLTSEDWIGRRLVADRLRVGRTFLAGDAAHIWVPYAGYGMNAGLADASTLGWQLAAVVRGWADERLLDAYELERGPVNESVSRAVMAHNDAMTAQRSAVPDNLIDDTPEGAAARVAIGDELYALNVQQYCAAGLNFGYHYAGSPVVIGDDVEPPSFTMSTFTESTVPGCRAPHFWIDDTTSLYDALSDGYTVLNLDGSDVANELAAAAGEVPVAVLDVAGRELPAAYDGWSAVVVRPDQHIAWRGNDADVSVWEPLAARSVFSAR